MRFPCWKRRVCTLRKYGKWKRSFNHILLCWKLMSKSHTSCSCIQEKPQETGPLTVDYDLKNIVKFVYFLSCLCDILNKLTSVCLVAPFAVPKARLFKNDIRNIHAVFVKRFSTYAVFHGQGALLVRSSGNTENVNVCSFNFSS